MSAARNCYYRMTYRTEATGCGPAFVYSHPTGRKQ